MALDNKNDTGVDQFMNFSQGEETVIPAEEYDPGAKFMQKGLNAYAKATGMSPLKEDGILGPKTQNAAQEMIKSLPPEMKRWAVNKLYKEMNKTEGDGGAGNTEGFKPPADTKVSPSEDIEVSPSADTEVNPFGEY